MEVPNKCDESIRLEVLIQKSVGLLVGNPKELRSMASSRAFWLLSLNLN